MSSHSHQVKDCIAQLCKMFKYTALCSVLPENFRQAKQNSNEAVSVMMQLLFSITHLLNERSAKDEQADLSSILKSYRYPRHSYIKKDKCGSRELLLCFSWLLHCCDVADIIKDIALRKSSSIKILMKEKNKNSKKSDCSSYDDAACSRFQLDPDCNSLSTSDQLNYVSWIMGKIELNADQLQALAAKNAQQRAVLTQEMYEVINVGSIKQPSNVDELLMLKHPHVAAALEKELEHKVLVLQAFMKWKDCQHIYWEWMTDVLDVVAFKSEISDDMFGKADDCPTVRNKVDSFGNCLSELKSSLYQMQKTWLLKVKEDSSTLNKIRVEQKVHVEKEAAEFTAVACGSLLSPQLLPSKYALKPTDNLPISLNNKKLADVAIKLKEELEMNQHIWKEEIAMTANKILGEKALLMPH